MARIAYFGQPRQSTWRDEYLDEQDDQDGDLDAGAEDTEIDDEEEEDSNATSGEENDAGSSRRNAGRGPRGAQTWNFLRKADGQPITRRDVQYDMLLAIFTDPTKAFRTGKNSHRVTFYDAYASDIHSSAKMSSTLKEKLSQSPTFERNFLMLGFLINVGRFNTTMAFHPDMRTLLRTFHAIPCLQHDERSKSSMQDCPRLKAIWRDAWDEQERKDFEDKNNRAEGAGPGSSSTRVGIPAGMLSTADGIEKRQRSLKSRQMNCRSTSLVNAITCLVADGELVSSKHYPDRLASGDFRTMFLPGETTHWSIEASTAQCQYASSRSRAKAFLWLLYHYVEDVSGPNPFGLNVAKPNAVPPMEILTKEEAELENVETQSEVEYGEEMRIKRRKSAAVKLEEETATKRLDEHPEIRRNSKVKSRSAEAVAKKGQIDDDGRRTKKAAVTDRLLALGGKRSQTQLERVNSQDLRSANGDGGAILESLRKPLAPRLTEQQGGYSKEHMQLALFVPGSAERDMTGWYIRAQWEKIYDRDVLYESDEDEIGMSDESVHIQKSLQWAEHQKVTRRREKRLRAF